jgi:hypothetical protein
MDVAGPEARCEQAEGGHQAAAVHAEQLVLVGDSQLDGAYSVDARKSQLISIQVKCLIPIGQRAAKASSSSKTFF